MVLRLFFQFFKSKVGGMTLLEKDPDGALIWIVFQIVPLGSVPWILDHILYVLGGHWSL